MLKGCILASKQGKMPLRSCMIIVQKKRMRKPINLLATEQHKSSLLLIGSTKQDIQSRI